MKTRLYI